MRLTFWRRMRFLLRGRPVPRSARRAPLRGLGRRAQGDALSQALLDLRSVVDAQQLEELPLAWFRVDEAKAAAAWYDPSREPAYSAVLPEEQALAERLYRTLTGRAATPAELLRAGTAPVPMLRYRLLAAHLPTWCAQGGRRAAEAVRATFELMHHSTDVLSPYGRWLLAQAVCTAARDTEELARQTERFRLVTGDFQAADGASMMFISGGEYELPLPVSLTEVLDHRDMPTRLEAFKKDAPRDLQRFFLQLTPRGQRLFLNAFMQRQEAYRHGYPWRKPAWRPSEGFVFVKQRVHLPAFFIDRRPVTQAQFAAFSQRQRQWLPSRVSVHAVDRDAYLPSWVGDAPAAQQAGEPVTGVSYQAARAYVAAHDKQLPTEAQWVYALVGDEVPETRQVGGEGRPSMSDEERALYSRRAAERGLHILLPERIYDFDGAISFESCHDRVLHDPRGPLSGSAHLWRTPTGRGRVPDLAGDANLTFRGVVPASRIWARTLPEAP
ncbi:MAG: SUMF1/EgtB/PvdO family nonheme iron enzyme [Fimbriimonadaceae bacterium]|nr:SUMF1/EgtB/PvdO family nonheme iron enzyme [Fimbriimonadaceae bacterium]